jgi:hypothetical protein
MPRPAIRVQSATIKTEYAVSAMVTVGPEHAAKLSKELGREVLPGEQFDIGVVSYYHPSTIRRLWGSWKASRRHLFSKQR